MSRIPPDDWRRMGQEQYLTGVTMCARKYRVSRPDWDHDHCEFCGAKFSWHAEDLDAGYSTEDERHWVCTPCFADFC